MSGMDKFYVYASIAAAIIIPLAKVFGNRRRKDMTRQAQQYLQASNLPANTPCYLVYKGMGTDGYMATAADALYMFPKAGQSYTVPYTTMLSFTVENHVGRLPTFVIQLASSQSLSFAVHNLAFENTQDMSHITRSVESLTSFLTSHGVASQATAAAPQPVQAVPSVQIPAAPQTQTPSVPQPVAVSPQPYVQTQPAMPPAQPMQPAQPVQPPALINPQGPASQP